MKLRRSIGQAAIIALVAAGAVIGVGSPASAEEVPDPAILAQDPDFTLDDLTDEHWGYIYEELAASSLPREVVTNEDGVSHEVITIEGIEIALPPTGTSDPDIVTPLVNGGLNDGTGRLWITFNQWDQDTLLNGGGTFLAAGICALSGALGAWTCLGVSLVIGHAVQWLSYNGKCPGNQELLLPFANTSAAIPPFAGGSHVRCVPANYSGG